MTEEEILREAQIRLPLEIRFAVEDPKRFKLLLNGHKLLLCAVPGFLYGQIKRPEIGAIFAEAAQKIAGISVLTIPMEIRREEPVLEALTRPPVPEPKPEKKFVDYKEWVLSPAWRRIRNAKLKDSGYKCELCGSAKNLQVHHITYEHIGDEPLDDLLTVCNKCHKKLHREDLKHS